MIRSLIRRGFEPVPLGNKRGRIAGIDILTAKLQIKDIHTVSIYLNPDNQKEYYQYILSLNPKRVIFNPGTYNEEFMKLVEQNEIECVFDCALIMLSKGSY